MTVRLHRQLTREAVTQELPELFAREVRMIVRGNAAVDHQVLFRYRREYHVDRIPFAPHADAWEMGQLVIAEREARIQQYAALGSMRKAYRHIGALLHTVQDLFSHSNFRNLNAEQQEECVSAFIGRKPIPQGFTICSYSLVGNLLPPGRRDPFNHAANHADLAPEPVYSGALDASRRILREIRKYLMKESMID